MHSYVNILRLITDTTLTYDRYSLFILARKISADSLSYLFRLNTVTGEDGGLEESRRGHGRFRESDF